MYGPSDIPNKNISQQIESLWMKYILIQLEHLIQHYFYPKRDFWTLVTEQKCYKKTIPSYEIFNIQKLILACDILALNHKLF